MIIKNLFIGVRFALLRLASNKRNNTSLTQPVCIFLIILILSGCAQHRPVTNPLLDKKALFYANYAQSFNEHFSASKGTGWVKFTKGTKTDKFRIAWIAASPNKIRITLLMAGHPVETIVASGKKITLISHTGEHSQYSVTAKNPSLDGYIKVPIKLSEMISILLGQLPVKPFDNAYFSPHDPAFTSISLEKNWKGTTQTLHFDDQGKIDRLNSTGFSGKQLYEVIITQYKTYDFGEVPEKIEITDKNNKKLLLHITNFQPNPPIKASVFRLTEPG